MNTQNNGGPAFPVTEDEMYNCDSWHGMTLRDYFAAKAMAALIAGAFTEIGQQGVEDNRAPFQNIEDMIAACAYDYADAMLKARES